MRDEQREPPSEAAPPWKTGLFLNEQGLRPGWRLVVFVLLLLGLSFPLHDLIRIIVHFRESSFPVMGVELFEEVGAFGIVLLASFVMSRIEHRPMGKYGLPANELLGGKFWLGFLFGLAEISLLVGLIAAFGGYSFGSLALRGNALLLWGLFHLLLFLVVGLYEEFLFRGYLQFTLGDGIGFWPAALLLSLLFGSGHLTNPGEGIVGATSVFLIGLVWCFTLRRTGSLWYAVGMHASFDWGETFLFSVPNSGTVWEGHLSNAVLHPGPKWLTGGTVGPEGSVFCFLTMGLQVLVVLWLFPRKKPG